MPFLTIFNFPFVTFNGVLTSYDLNGTAYKVATREPAFAMDRAAAATV